MTSCTQWSVSGPLFRNWWCSFRFDPHWRSRSVIYHHKSCFEVLKRITWYMTVMSVIDGYESYEFRAFSRLSRDGMSPTVPEVSPSAYYMQKKLDNDARWTLKFVQTQIDQPWRRSLASIECEVPTIREKSPVTWRSTLECACYYQCTCGHMASQF